MATPRCETDKKMRAPPSDVEVRRERVSLARVRTTNVVNAVCSAVVQSGTLAASTP